MSVINFIKSIYKQTHKRDPRPSQGGSQKQEGSELSWVELAAHLGHHTWPAMEFRDAPSLSSHISPSLSVSSWDNT